MSCWSLPSQFSAYKKNKCWGREEDYTRRNASGSSSNWCFPWNSSRIIDFYLVARCGILTLLTFQCNHVAEIMNLRNLEKVLAREEEVKKRAIVHKAVYSGPQIRYLSKNGKLSLFFLSILNV